MSWWCPLQAQTTHKYVDISCPLANESLSASYDDFEGDKVSTGKIILDPLGNILDQSSNFNFDENDNLEVYILGGSEDFLKTLKVERSSGARDPGIVRIIGDSQAAKINPATSFYENLNPKCSRKYEIDNFAPGEGVINISKYDEPSKANVNLGSTKIRVNPLYSGMFTLGIVKTDLVERDYTVENDVIIDKNTGKEDYMYALMYTPFIWGKRDLEKYIDWWKRINPTFGISFEDVADNVFVGISIDLPANVLITYGKHFGKVSSIASESGLSVGDSFTGSIPESESWEDETFVAISFDIRAITKLFSAQSSN